jgi:hypothetical protein
LSRSSQASLPARRDAPPRVALRDLVTALSIATVGALGAIPGAHGSDPLAVLAWISMWSVPAGVLIGASSAPLWPIAPAVPALWMALFALVAASSTRILPSPVWSAFSWTGLYAVGFACGRSFPKLRWPLGSAAFAGAAALNALAISGAWLATPFSARVSARLLDLAPATLLAECAGLDWLRHPGIYEPAGALDIDPALRGAWRGVLAGPIVFLVGCTVALLAERLARRRRRASDARGGIS